LILIIAKKSNGIKFTILIATGITTFGLLNYEITKVCKEPGPIQEKFNEKVGCEVVTIAYTFSMPMKITITVGITLIVVSLILKRYDYIKK
jgi:hypothetical protein